MSRIHSSILSTIGNTPLVDISSPLEAKYARVLAKVESFNPGGSAKDRVAIAMVDAAEKSGALKPGGMIIEPTSGNTGVGLALVAAVRGYKMVLTMPDTMSQERILLAKAYGADVVLTPGNDGMAGAIAKAQQLHEENSNSFIPQQFENPSNPQSHYLTTGPEIWNDTDGKVDVFVAGIGTGGTFSGVGKYLREKNPAVELIAVEPSDSPMLSEGHAGPHKLQGIGANFIPKIMDTSLISRIVPVDWNDAGIAARSCAAKCGILVGISAGAALHAALTLGNQPEYAGKTIVVLLPDTGERYLSTWLFK